MGLLAFNSKRVQYWWSDNIRSYSTTLVVHVANRLSVAYENKNLQSIERSTKSMVVIRIRYHDDISGCEQTVVVCSEFVVWTTSSIYTVYECELVQRHVCENVVFPHTRTLPVSNQSRFASSLNYFQTVRTQHHFGVLIIGIRNRKTGDF